MPRRKYDNRLRRTLSQIGGSSIYVSIPVEHLRTLDWKKGKSVKTEIINGVWMVSELDVDVISAVSKSDAELLEQIKKMNEELDNKNIQLNEANQKLDKQSEQIAKLESDLKKKQDDYMDMVRKTTELANSITLLKGSFGG